MPDHDEHERPPQAGGDALQQPPARPAGHGGDQDDKDAAAGDVDVRRLERAADRLGRAPERPPAGSPGDDPGNQDH